MHTYVFGEDLDTSRRIDDGTDQRPLGVELLNVSKGVTLAALPAPDEIARLRAAAGVTVLAGLVRKHTRDGQHDRPVARVRIIGLRG